MTTTEQAGATEREAVERLAHFIGWHAERIPQNYSYEPETRWGKVGFWRSPEGRISKSLEWNPFDNPTDERELLNAVQERWGRPAHTEGREPEASMWWALHRALMQTFSRRYADEDTDGARNISQAMFWLLFARAGDIARAVDEVLREYPEIV